MNLNDYENKYFATYAAFAETVRFILNSALLVAENLPRPQSVQCRAKGAESLRRRLEEVAKLDTQTLELERRDLAGARIMFYTNSDVDRFLASRLIYENFEIEDDSIRIHHPTPENEGACYGHTPLASTDTTLNLALPAVAPTRTGSNASRHQRSARLN